MMLNGKTRVLGLLGDPIEHTMSPLIHNNLSRIMDDNEVYVPFHTYSDGLGDAVRGAYELGVLGMNVTVPHKKEVMKYLTDIDEGAKIIGAVNTLVRVDGGYKGYNTDMMGIARELAVYGVNLEKKFVVILGAGGAARAVAYMCLDKGAERVYILNRTVAKAEQIADDMNMHFGRKAACAMSLDAYEKLKNEDAGDGFVVFQSTSIGLAPNTDAAVIEDEDFYKMISVGIDLIYNPFETKFMKLCKAAGVVCYNGLRMLLYQAIIAYELWNGRKISEDTADLVYKSLLKTARKNIILIGFMGCGKTTIGRALSEVTGYELIDVDSYIENAQGCTVKDIFMDHGEEYFRNLETEAVRELGGVVSNSIISTGGGLPMRIENVEGLDRLGNVIYLKTTPGEVYRRLKGDTTRPLLRGDDAQARISELMSKRVMKYAGAADFTVDTTGKSVENIVADILRLVRFEE